MRETIMSPSSHPPAVGRFSSEQLAHRGGWETLPELPITALAAMRVVHMAPMNGSTITELNPLDPGTVADVEPFGPGNGNGWKFRPHGYGYISRAGR